MVCIPGAMAIHTVDNFTMARKTDKVIGGKQLMIPQMLILENISMIKSMDTESFSGAQVLNTKETTLKMLKKDMEKCTGLMEASTEDSGKKDSNKDWA